MPLTLEDHYERPRMRIKRNIYAVEKSELLTRQGRTHVRRFVVKSRRRALLPYTHYTSAYSCNNNNYYLFIVIIIFFFYGSVYSRPVQSGRV